MSELSTRIATQTSAHHLQNPVNKLTTSLPAPGNPEQSGWVRRTCSKSQRGRRQPWHLRLAYRPGSHRRGGDQGRRDPFLGWGSCAPNGRRARTSSSGRWCRHQRASGWGSQPGRARDLGSGSTASLFIRQFSGIVVGCAVVSGYWTRVMGMWEVDATYSQWCEDAGIRSTRGRAVCLCPVSAQIQGAIVGRHTVVAEPLRRGAHFSVVPNVSTLEARAAR
jgi:hypothetical protein